jgi:hypothetical protein
MEFFNIVNGECRSSDDVHQGINPRTEELLWKAPLATVADLDEAVAAAEKALPEWSGHSLAERQALLVKLAETMKAHSAELQEIVMQETGKSVSIPPDVVLGGSVAGPLIESTRESSLRSRSGIRAIRLCTTVGGWKPVLGSLLTSAQQRLGSKTRLPSRMTR